MTSPRGPRRLVALAIGLAVIAGACSDGTDETVDSESLDDAAAELTNGDESEDDESEDDESESDDEFDGGDDCTQEALSGDDPEFVFTSAFRIVDGELGELCFGEEEEILRSAWDSLVAITPPEQLGDLGLFGGFEPDGDAAAETLAFVNALDADGTQFQMSINTVESVVDADELLLTLAHEFSHVFTGTPAQLDRTDEAVDSCETYFSGDGCYFDDALIVAWIEAFWDAELLDSVDPLEDSVEDADARCDIESGFFGPYAATNPEEDFAEAFSAFVFRLEPSTDGQADRLAWIEEQPGLVEFRDRADAAGMTPLDNNFDVCGE